MPRERYVEITPGKIAVSHLCDCAEQLERSSKERIRVAHAAKSAHLAFQAALTAALAGSASIGAFPPKLRQKWIAWFEESRDVVSLPPPSDDYVMNFGDLLAAARADALRHYGGEPLEVSAEDEALLQRLVGIRHSIEHVKPRSHWFEPAYLRQPIVVASRLTARLLQHPFVSLHLTVRGRAAVRRALRAVEKLYS